MPDLTRYSTTKATSLASAMTSGDTSVALVDGSTYPDPAVPGNGPYTVLIGYGSDREEICTVTAKPSTNVLTVVRAQDGSSAVAKNIGDIVVHGVSKRDWNDMLDKTVGGTLSGPLVLAGDPATDLGAATKQYVDDNDALRATLVSPAFTGTPTAPTASPGTNTTQVATTAFVAAADALKANIASPALTGTPTAPTASVGTATTQIANTAFVNAEIANDAPSKTGTGASGTWGIGITGNAATATNATSATTATRLASARSISLTGDVTGSTNFDGSANVSITATVSKVQHGQVSGSYTTGGFVVAFPTAFSTTIPRVVATSTGSSGTATPIICMTYNVQLSAFSLKLYDVGGGERSAGSGYIINWIATNI